jgi:hypothetical protein
VGLNVPVNRDDVPISLFVLEVYKTLLICTNLTFDLVIACQPGAEGGLFSNIYSRCR